ncbi:hypothetical protein Tco_0202651 [Tanacetum coccineum]
MAQRRATAPSIYIHYFQQEHHHCYLYHYLYHPLDAELTFPRLTRHLGRGYYLLLLHLGLRLGRALLLDSYDLLCPAGSITVLIESLGFYSRHQEAHEDQAAVRAEIEILRREKLIYEQESIETRQALARSKAYSRALEARIRVLETQAYHHEWQR